MVHPQYALVVALVSDDPVVVHRPWSPKAERIIADHKYEIALPSGTVVHVKRHWYNVGGNIDKWWKVYWPESTFIHEVGTLKEACALVKQYVDNENTIPLEGAFDTCLPKDQ